MNVGDFFRPNSVLIEAPLRWGFASQDWKKWFETTNEYSHHWLFTKQTHNPCPWICGVPPWLYCLLFATVSWNDCGQKLRRKSYHATVYLILGGGCRFSVPGCFWFRGGINSYCPKKIWMGGYPNKNMFSVHFLRDSPGVQGPDAPPRQHDCQIWGNSAGNPREGE